MGAGGFLVGTNGFQVRTSGLREGGVTLTVTGGALVVVVGMVIILAAVVGLAVVAVLAVVVILEAVGVMTVVDLEITGKTLFCVMGGRRVVVVLFSSLSGMWLWWFGGIFPGLGTSMITFGMAEMGE